MRQFLRHFALAGVLATAFVGTTPARAAGTYSLQTGADLAAVCGNPVDAQSLTGEERQRLAICGAYIQGFLAHSAIARPAMNEATFCLPATGVSAEQVRQLFLALLEQRPQIRDLPASLDLATSLTWGYSCQKQKAQ